MKTIKDSVHDHIRVDGVARELLDTPPVQRLRHVRQLGTVHLVYPSANHTRFEHSLGVYHLATRALDELRVEGRAAEHVQAAALLHDIGHAPFSHNIEELIARRTGQYHDDVDDLLLEPVVETILRERDLEPRRVADLIRGRGTYGQLISGELDVDRMDYLVRDAHHTGVPYGTIDHGRLLKELRFVDGELVLAAGNVESAESMLVARALMNPTVYNHHVARISKSMLRRAARALLDTSDLDANTLRRLDDYGLIVRLREHEPSAELAHRLTDRRLFKRALWTEHDRVPSFVFDAAPAELTHVERAIAERAGVSPDTVILDRPQEPVMRESTSRIVVGDEIVRLGERSPLVRALRTIQREQWRLGVYTPSEQVEVVARAGAEELDLDLSAGTVVDRDVGRYARLDEFDGRDA